MKKRVEVKYTIYLVSIPINKLVVDCYELKKTTKNNADKKQLTNFF